MNHRDADAFRLFTREWHERRVREADMERFAREIRASGRRRPLWMAAVSCSPQATAPHSTASIWCLTTPNGIRIPPRPLPAETYVETCAALGLK